MFSPSATDQGNDQEMDEEKSENDEEKDNIDDEEKCNGEYIIISMHPFLLTAISL
jgi:hypothetical protein